MVGAREHEWASGGARRSVLIKGFYEQLCVGEGNKPEIGSTSNTLSDNPGASERANEQIGKQMSAWASKRASR